MARGRKKKEDRIRDPERTKEKILSAATSLFTKAGFNGASLDDISKAAGVNRGLIYHYFKNKELLFDHVLAKPIAAYLESHLDFLSASEVTVCSLKESTTTFYNFLGEHPELVRLLAWTMAMRRIAIDLAQLELTRSLFSKGVARIKEGQAKGHIRNDMSARYLLITIVDLCVSWHLSRDEWLEKLNWDEEERASIDQDRLVAILDLLEAAAIPRK